MGDNTLGVVKPELLYPPDRMVGVCVPLWG